jgi:hypothetical protein
MRRVLKWSGITVLGLLALALLLFAAALIINAHDEELSPQARALLTPAPNPYRPEDNIYLALVGADAPVGESVITAGLTKISSYEQRVDALMRNPTLVAQEAFLLAPENPQRLAFKGDCTFVKPLQESLWQTIPPHREQVEKLLADNRELYQRYLALHELHGYYETARPSWLMPSMPWPVCERKVFLAEYVLRTRFRDLSEQRQAFGELQDDIRLWRRIFTGDGALVSKMLSAAYLQQDYLLLADTIADPRATVPGSAQDDSGLQLLDLGDWDLGSTYAAEFRVSSFVLRQTDELSRSAWTADGEPRGGLRRELARLYNRVGGQFFKLNATENLLARQTERRTSRARDPETFFKTTYDSPDSPFVPRMSAWEYPRRLSYNPLGKVLVAISDPAYEQYPPRVWDVAALQRVVRLGYEIRRQRIAASAIPAFLEQHPEWSTHPADGRPFLWDARTGELRVRTVAKQSPARRFSVPVWRASH